MSIVSVEFGLYLMLTSIVFAVIPRVGIWYKLFLIFVSLGFLASFSWYLVGFSLVYITINYAFVNILQRASLNLVLKRIVLAIAILANLVCLGVFKYSTFIVDLLLEFSNKNNLNWSLNYLELVVPLGISFFTFRIVSHLVDSYKQKVTTNILDFSAYTIFFPYIIAGPLVSATSFYNDLRAKVTPDFVSSNFLFLIIRGLFKKLVISSYLYQFYLTPFAQPGDYNSTTLVATVLIYAVYIYTDFSGYSDLAIGFSNLFGFYPAKNFNSPYSAISPSQFWQKWHISLSDWFKNYLYFPLGGDGRNSPKWKHFIKWRNLFLIMFISGIWHGAGLNFIIWGALWGLFLILEDVWNWFLKSVKLPEFTINTFLKKILKWVKVILGWAFTFTITVLLWLPFAIDSDQKLQEYFSTLLQFNFQNLEIDFRPLVLSVLIIGLNFNGSKIEEYCLKFLKKSNVLVLFLITLLCGYLIIQLGPELIPPFVYSSF